MRRAILELTDFLLTDILKNVFCKDRAIVSIIENALPEDAEIVRVGMQGNNGNANYGYDETGVLRLLLQSKEFEETPQGCHYRVLPAPTFMREEICKPVKYEDHKPFISGDYWAWYNPETTPTIQYWDGKQFSLKAPPTYWADITYPAQPPIPIMGKVEGSHIDGVPIDDLDVEEGGFPNDDFDDLDTEEGVIPLEDLKRNE